MESHLECWTATVSADKYSAADAQQSTLRCRTYVRLVGCGGVVGVMIVRWIMNAYK